MRVHWTRDSVRFVARNTVRHETVEAYFHDFRHSTQLTKRRYLATNLPHIRPHQSPRPIFTPRRNVSQFYKTAKYYSIPLLIPLAADARGIRSRWKARKVSLLIPTNEEKPLGSARYDRCTTADINNDHCSTRLPSSRPCAHVQVCIQVRLHALKPLLGVLSPGVRYVLEIMDLSRAPRATASSFYAVRYSTWHASTTCPA